MADHAQGGKRRSAFRGLPSPWRRGLNAVLLKAPAYRAWRFSGAFPEDLRSPLLSPALGDGRLGADLAQDALTIAGCPFRLASPAPVWPSAYDEPAAVAFCHGFAWIPHVFAADEAHHSLIAAAVDQWIAEQSDWSPLTWSPAVLSRRVLGWLTAGSVVFGPQEGASMAARREALGRHLQALDAAIAGDGAPAAQFTCAIALAAAGVCFDNQDAILDRGLTAVCLMADAHIYADGGHMDRRPETVVELLRDLRALDATLVAAGYEPPEPLTRAINRLRAMARFFRMPDGGLACFHGGGESDPKAIDLLVGSRDSETEGARPFDVAPNSGYQRVSRPKCVLLVDSADPPPSTAGTNGHESLGAFEFATAAGRLVTNCGWSAGHQERFRDPVRLMAAHSTIDVLDRTPKHKRWPFGIKSVRLGGVVARRHEEDAGAWIEVCHDVRWAEARLARRRRLFVSHHGGELRGEDTLFRPIDEPALPMSPAAFAIRFHLHPDVRAAIAGDGASILLLLAEEETWRFRCDSGALSLEDSFYLGGGAPARPSQQIVIRDEARPDGAVDAPPNRTRWAFQRIGCTPFI